MKLLVATVLMLVGFYAGAWANALVESANHGNMPVLVPAQFVNAYADPRHCAITKDTKYGLLGDMIIVGPYIASIGDVLIFSSLGVYGLWAAVQILELAASVLLYRDVSKNGVFMTA